MQDYKLRMVKEYQELKDKCEKLNRMLVQYEAGTLPYTPDTPIELSYKQLKVMLEYMHILEVRAECRKLDLNMDLEGN